MKRRFRYTNKEYCQMVYEYIGVWAERAAYTEDLTEYYLYYGADDAEKVVKHIKQISLMLGRLEGAAVFWYANERCLKIIMD